MDKSVYCVPHASYVAHNKYYAICKILNNRYTVCFNKRTLG